ncbi:LysM peptidoglycan-binding domain-containing protein [Microcella frigidaquae]|uniref:Nucleoid-associated protein YgaU n=1 Tax=Microcella frigidaquae TaxID=424758 RepID=A0A840X6Z5_9MICO|nr:LysM peptidoglycan-binding domain-containing protein [Microcella frigidaquae]MBB5616984.1 nucleoid-associated protein YgaU [Microcella frigidaquae]NHN45433.1 LysM peptidoglycan-binding domain-containing protein [Microcella frigidaquae]
MSSITYSSTAFAMPTVARTRLRLTRRGRFVVAALVSLPLVLGLLGIALNGGGAVAGSTAAPETVTVQAGQSLWSLAEELAPDAATADVVADLVAVNGLAGGAVLPGQVLIVPAAYAD